MNWYWWLLPICVTLAGIAWVAWWPYEAKGPSHSFDMECIGRIILSAIAAFFCFVVVAAFTVGHWLIEKREPPPPPKPERIVLHSYHYQCPGCKNWFWTDPRQNEEPPSIPDTCPLCPLSEEEFEKLKEQLRNR